MNAPFARFCVPVLALALAVLAAATLATWAKLQAERTAHQTTKTTYAENVEAAERQRADTEAKRRKAEQELIDAQEAHAAEVAALSADVERARAAGRAASERVRNAARATAALAGQVCTDTTSTQLREAATGAANLLADVLSEFEQRATALAGVADDRGIAGRACERAYTEAHDKLKAH